MSKEVVGVASEENILKDILQLPKLDDNVIVK